MHTLRGVDKPCWFFLNHYLSFWVFKSFWNQCLSEVDPSVCVCVCMCVCLSPTQVSKRAEIIHAQIIPPSPPQCESPFCSRETGKVSGGILAWSAYPASNFCANLSSALPLIIPNIVSIWLPQIIHWVEQSAGSVTHPGVHQIQRWGGRRQERRAAWSSFPWSEWGATLACIF